MLRHFMSEDRPENAQIVAASIAGSDHGLVVQLIGDPDPRGEGRERAFHVQVQSNSLRSRHQHFAGSEIDEAAFSGSVDSLRTVNLPAKTIVEREFLGHAPRILAVEKPAILCFTRIGNRAYVALEQLDI